MTVKEMVSEYLTTNKYDGYKHKCPEGHESDWLMTSTKEPPNFDE